MIEGAACDGVTMKLQHNVTEHMPATFSDVGPHIVHFNYTKGGGKCSCFSTFQAIFHIRHLNTSNCASRGVFLVEPWISMKVEGVLTVQKENERA